MSLLGLSTVNESGCLSDAEVTSAIEKYHCLLKAENQKQYSESLGWLNPAQWATEDWISKYLTLAEKVRNEADILVVIGVGGSNQAARAVVDALGERGNLKIVWAGNNISAFEIERICKMVSGKRFFVNLIAKNFETLEPGIAFRVFRKLLQDAYGSMYSSHVICTGTEESHLHDLCKKHGYTFLPFPKDIGGRYTAISPICLFPVAAAGLDVRALSAGALQMYAFLHKQSPRENLALHYAVTRNLLYQKGYRIEMLSFFEPRLFRFSKWWIQLFGESEGKQNSGLYPTAGNFSEDLHSIGQFIQDGTPILFETHLSVKDCGGSCVSESDGVDDHFDYLNGVDFAAINQAAFHATTLAHSQRFPCLILEIDRIDEFFFGQLFYFFMYSCYLSAQILGVNPFDQPGVETYKYNMFSALGKDSK